MGKAYKKLIEFKYAHRWLAQVQNDTRKICKRSEGIDWLSQWSALTVIPIGLAWHHSSRVSLADCANICTCATVPQNDTLFQRGDPNESKCVHSLHFATTAEAQNVTRLFLL